MSLGGKIINYIENYDEPNVKLSYWRDRAKIINNRLDTLQKSAWQGIILVFILLESLGLYLEELKLLLALLVPWCS